MINILKEDIGLVWKILNDEVARADDKKFLTLGLDKAQQYLKFTYSDIVSSLMYKAAKSGVKNAKQLDYAKVKANRTIETLTREGVICGDYEVCYAKRDIFKEFPQFNKPDFEILPTEKSINKLKVAVIQKNVENYNKYALENGKKEIKDLRSLRLFLLNGLKLEEAQATELTQMYNSMNISEIAWNVK